ncbi:DUF397 domain-containing protein [Stackebrandtia sp.]|uniref:DUF397 domain-containing protein n=1 Tax=Stackebrandtia sp. TaxID=2023065 RepID=UPI0032C2108E
MTNNETLALHPKWRRSSRSANNASQNCVEVTTWRKSTHSSGNGGQCVEVAVLRLSPLPSPRGNRRV